MSPYYPDISHRPQKSRTVTRPHYTNTFGQVFTTRCCADNRAVQYETP